MLMYMYFSNNRCGTATIQERQLLIFIQYLYITKVSNVFCQ